MTWLAAALLIIATVLPASAQDGVRVRSGEHASFSRLVFYLPEPREWRLGREADGYGLRIGGGALAFDLQDVFRFIPRTRLADLSAVSDGVDLALACDCHAIAFEFRPDILVVDVRDGPPQAGSRFETVLDEEKPAPRPRSADTVRSGALPGLSERLLSLELPLDDVTKFELDADATMAAASGTALSEFRNELVESVGTALSSGLARPAAQPSEQISSEPGMPRAVPTPYDEQATSGADATDHNAWVVTDAHDLFAADTGHGLDAAHSVECLPGIMFDLGAGAAASAMAGVADARRRLAADGEEPGEGAVFDLARAYLILGFGAEAGRVLEAHGMESDEAGLLRDIAATVDRPGEAPAESAQRLASQAACGTAGAMWAVLASGGRDLPAPVNEAALLRTVSSLPPSLRSHVAPPLSRSLRRLELDDLAAAVRAAVERTGADPDPAFLLEREDALADTNAGASGTSREAAATSDPSAGQPPRRTPSPDRRLPAPKLSVTGLEAAARSVRRIAEGRDPPDSGLLDDAAALLHAAKGAEESMALFDALPQALGVAGRYDEALAVISRMEDSVHGAVYDIPRAHARLGAELVGRADDGALVLLLARQQAVLPEAWPDSLRRGAAERLTDLGVTQLARRYAPPLTPRSDASLRALHSRIALREGEDMEALARIASVDGVESDALRAEALGRAAAFDRAAAYAEQIGAAGHAAEWAWAGSDWRRAAATLPEGPRRDLALRLSELQQAGGGSVPGPVREQAEAAPEPRVPSLAAAVASEPGSGGAGLADLRPQPRPGSARAAVPGVPPGAVDAVAEPDDVAALPELARRRLLLEDSEVLRDTIDALLAAPPQSAAVPSDLSSASAADDR